MFLRIVVISPYTCQCILACGREKGNIVKWFFSYAEGSTRKTDNDNFNNDANCKYSDILLLLLCTMLEKQTLPVLFSFITETLLR